MPALNTPETYLDDVASGVQRDYHAGREQRAQVANRALAGDGLVAEQVRLNFATDNRLVGAAVAQALLGTNQYLAGATLADNSVAGQPFRSPDPTQNPVQTVKTS